MNDLDNTLKASYNSTIYGPKSYIVKGWYMNSNGNVISYVDNEEQSFYDKTMYNADIENIKILTE